jgi:hypothetical protein
MVEPALIARMATVASIVRISVHLSCRPRLVWRREVY